MVAQLLHFNDICQALYHLKIRALFFANHKKVITVKLLVLGTRPRLKLNLCKPFCVFQQGFIQEFWEKAAGAELGKNYLKKNRTKKGNFSKMYFL